MQKGPLLAAAALTAMTATGGLFYANSRRESLTRLKADMGTKISVQQSAANRQRQPEFINGGIIQGRAVNSDAQPVVEAKACVEKADALIGRQLCSSTDNEGNFRIEVPEPGTYTVFGSKEEDGYPLTISGFHREEGILVPKVYVEARQTVRDVILQLGSKAATIHGTVTDATDRKPVSKVTITLRRADNPNIYYEIGAAEPKANGRFKVLVSPVPFTIEVSSSEYETWTYSETGRNGHADALTVNRGQTKRLNIMLRRRSKPNN